MAVRSSAVAVAREMEDVLVTIVDESRAVDGLVVTDGQIAVQRRAAGGLAIDGDRLDPVDRVLEGEHPAGHPCDVEAGPGIGWLRADVEEERAVGRARAPRPRASAASRADRPGGAARRRGAVADAEVVGRRRHDHVDRIRFEAGQQIEAVAMEERTGRGATRDGAERGRQRREAPHARKDSAPR